jgi:release factor glutamine methyltransferase
VWARLIAHVLDVGPNDVLLKARESLATEEEAAARALLELRATRMPLQYATRTAYFGGLRLRSDDRALIPRQETEQLVDAVLDRLPGVALAPDEWLADIGCGTGVIGLTIAARVPHLRVILSDISAEAVALARENAESLGLTDRVTLLEGSYLEPLSAAGLNDRVSVLVCNPPYVRPREVTMLTPEIHAEPLLAITSPAADGLEGYRIMAQQIAGLPRLRLLAFEVGFAQEEDVADLFRPVGTVEILPDFQGIERVVIVHVR